MILIPTRERPLSRISSVSPTPSFFHSFELEMTALRDQRAPARGHVRRPALPAHSSPSLPGRLQLGREITGRCAPPKAAIRSASRSISHRPWTDCLRPCVTADASRPKRPMSCRSVGRHLPGGAQRDPPLSGGQWSFAARLRRSPWRKSGIFLRLFARGAGHIPARDDYELPWRRKTADRQTKAVTGMSRALSR